MAAARAALLQHDRAAASRAAASRTQAHAQITARLAEDRARSQQAHDALEGMEARYGKLRAEVCGRMHAHAQHTHAPTQRYDY